MSERRPPGLVSVIMPVRDTAGALPNQLRALSEQTFDGDWELIVVDNGSTDGTPEVAAEWSNRIPSMRIVEALEKRNMAYPRNVGVHSATGDLLLFCDGDDEVCSDWIERMSHAAGEGDLVQGAMDYDSLNEPRLPWMGQKGRNMIPGTGEFDFLPVGVGANIGIWRASLERLGGWNEAYENGSDDTELMWRALLAGLKVVTVEDAVVKYRLRRSLKGYAKQRFRRARAAVRLFKDYRSEGMPRTSPRIALMTWASLIYRLPFALVSQRWRVEWVQRASVSAGRLVGSIEQRVCYL